MQPEDLVRMAHMRDACASIQRFLHAKERIDLSKDELLQFALVRALEIIGEAAARVSESTRLSAPEIPWREATSIRNRLIHAYFDVDLDVLWVTVSESVPLLHRQLESLLSANGSAGAAGRAPPG